MTNMSGSILHSIRTGEDLDEKYSHSLTRKLLILITFTWLASSFYLFFISHLATWKAMLGTIASLVVINIVVWIPTGIYLTVVGALIRRAKVKRSQP